MLENIIMILFYIWLLGTIVFAYLCTILKVEKDKTVLELSSEKIMEEMPTASPKTINFLTGAILLLMTILWPIALIFAIFPKS